MGFIYIGFLVNPFDLAPCYTGFIVGFSSACSVWFQIVVPIFFDAVTTNKTREEWQFAYVVTAGMQVATILFYCMFASGDIQPWAHDTYSTLSDETQADRILLDDKTPVVYGSSHGDNQGMT